MSEGKRVIVVTGSYKGIGLEIVRLLCEHYGDQATVFMTARDLHKATPSLQLLHSKGLKPLFVSLSLLSSHLVSFQL